jgi:transcriptional regulator with XRE-family HTH domain
MEPRDPINSHSTPTVGANIRAERTRRRLTIDELARLTGISVRKLSELERDVRSPRVDDLFVIAAALAVTPSDLLAGCFQPLHAALAA